MKQYRWLILLGVVTFVVGVVTMFPARVAYSLFAPDGIRLSVITGTLWNGSVAEAEVSGLYIGDLSWSFQPGGLFRGELGYAVEASPAGGIATANIGVGFGEVNLRNLEGGLSIAAIQSVVSTPGIEGSTRFDFPLVRLENGFPTAADGTVEIRGLVARGLSQAPLGDFRAVLASSDASISGSIEDLAGVLDIAGSLRIGANRTYLLTGLVAPTPETPEGIVNQLRFLGSPNERGQRQFRFEGRL